VRVAFVLVLLIFTGCVTREAPQDAPREDTQTDDASTRPIVQTFSGSATGTPASPDEQTFAFEVPRGAVGVNGTLSYARPPAALPVSRGEPFEFLLLDPDGEIASEGYRDVEGRLIVATIEPPKAGEWTFVVRGVAAVQTAFELEAVAELIVPADNVVAKSLSLGQRSFYEVNLIMEEGASFRFSFNSSAPLAWDVHSHPASGVKEWETGEGTTGGAQFQAPARDVYSVLWENTGALPADLAFEIRGAFRIHSHSG
jgi:hypothetical protein